MTEDEEKRPLQDEAEAREEWRGKDRLPAHGGEGVELPVSEADGRASAEGDVSGRGQALSPPD